MHFPATNYSRQVARYAVRALYLELQCYPKPGLVSFIDSGAHCDMDAKKFYISLASLRHYFVNASAAGARHCDFENLKQLALVAEAKMLRRTEGINTHRGAIFSLGLMSATISAFHILPTPQELRLHFIERWGRALESHQAPASSNGTKVRKQYGVKGAKELALDGYAPVFDYLSEFVEIFKKTNDLNAAVLHAYAHLMQHIDDTNILHRCDIGTLESAKRRSRELLEEKDSIDLIIKGVALHKDFSVENISPGGVADMIALLLFLAQVYQGDLAWP